MLERLMPEGWGQERMGVSTNEYGVSFWGNGSLLQLDHGVGYTIY